MRNTCLISGAFQFRSFGELILTETASLVYNTEGNANRNHSAEGASLFAVHFKGALMTVSNPGKVSKEITRNADTYLSIRTSIAAKYIITKKKKKVKSLDIQK